MKIQLTSIALLLAGTTVSMNIAALELTDLNNDGVISTEEVQAAREAAKAETLTQFDADNNGQATENIECGCPARWLRQ